MKSVLLISFLVLHAALASAQDFTQTVRGVITDVDSQQPLVGAVVQIPALKTGNTTDEDGAFRLSHVPVGRYDVNVSYMGYESSLIPNVEVTSGKEVVLNISLKENVKDLQEVVIQYDRTKDRTVTNNDMTVVSARSFNVEETERYAGSLGDPSRMAANFAGVSSANDSRNDIVIRGNSPGGLLWQLEGLNIPNPNHFGAINSTGGPVSMLNNNTLAKSDFLTSAFPAQYGNALSGVFDVRLRNGNDEHYEFLGQIGFNGLEALAEGPINKNSKSSFLVDYRYSTLGLFQQLNIDFGTGSATPDYQDLNFKLHFPFKNGSISVFGLAGKSDVSFLGNETDTTKLDFYGSRFTNTIVDYKTGIAGVSIENNLSDKTFSKLTLGVSHVDQNFHGDSISYITFEELPSGNGSFAQTIYSLVYDLSHKFDRRNVINSGLTIDYYSFNLFNEKIDDGITHITRIDLQDEAALPQAYTQWKHRFNDKLTFKGGINLLYFSLSESFALDPRAGFTYQVSPKDQLGIGYGLESRMQQITSYAIETPVENGSVRTNQDMGFTRSHQFVLSYDHSFSQDFHVKTEAYYQHLFNVPVESHPSSYSILNSGADFAPDFTDSLINEGTGRNYGVEITAEKYLSMGYYFLLTASLFDSKYKGSDGVERNTAFNTQYVFNVLGGKEFEVGRHHNAVGLDVKFSTSGGKYLTPIDVEASEAQHQTVYDESKAFTEKQDPYLRCDAKFYFKKNLKKASMEFALELQNLTNHKNVFDQSYDIYQQKVITNYQQGFFPVPMFRMNF